MFILSWDACFYFKFNFRIAWMGNLWEWVQTRGMYQWLDTIGMFSLSLSTSWKCFSVIANENRVNGQLNIRANFCFWWLRRFDGDGYVALIHCRICVFQLLSLQIYVPVSTWCFFCPKILCSVAKCSLYYQTKPIKCMSIPFFF